MALSQETRAALEWIRDDYCRIVEAARSPELDGPSDGTKWTNRELLFHMWFGQRIARAMVPVMGGFSHLPPAASRAYAALLTAATRPYEWVNYAGSVGYRIGNGRVGFGVAYWERDSSQRVFRSYDNLRFGTTVTYGF